MPVSAAEEFGASNDNVALFGLGVIERLWDYLNLDYRNGFTEPVYFRARWTAIEQKAGGRDIRTLGQNICIPYLEIEYVIDSYDTYNHIDKISPFDEEVGLDEKEIACIERLASSYETRIIRLG